LPLQFTYLADSRLPINLTGIDPSRQRGQSLTQIQQTPVPHGNQRRPLGDLFRITGDPHDGVWIFAGDLQCVHRLGAGMSAGTLHVDGSVGHHAGSQLRGGTLQIDGNAGDWTGAEMAGGIVRIRGNAGHQLAAAYPGSPRGMTEGVVLVEGNAGDGVGRKMRRGLVAVGGDVGDLAAQDMLAGTVVAGGRCGQAAGMGMRRGTLVLPNAGAVPLLPSFRFACRAAPVFAAVLERNLIRLGMRGLPALAASPAHVFHGDHLALGRGEVLIGGD
jgi:formylmethanofuran dehydrogenase subunit C